MRSALSRVLRSQWGVRSFLIMIVVFVATSEAHWATIKTMLSSSPQEISINSAKDSFQKHFQKGSDSYPGSFKLSDGSNVRLPNLKGSVVLFTFWASWCAPCVTEIESLQTLRHKYNGDELKIIGVVVDKMTRDDLSRFIYLNKINYSIGIADAGLLDYYGGAPLLPMTIVFDKQSRIASAYIGLQSFESIEHAARELL